MDFKGRPIPNFYDFVGGTLMENNNRDWPDIVDNTPLDIIMKEKTLSKWPDNEKTPPFNGRLERNANFKNIKFPDPKESPMTRKTPNSRLKVLSDSSYRKSPIYEYKNCIPIGPGGDRNYVFLQESKQKLKTTKDIGKVAKVKSNNHL